EAAHEALLDLCCVAFRDAPDAHGSVPGRPVQPALLDLVLFPPPAPGSLVLAGRRRACAGRAADRGVTLVVQRVVGDLVAAHVVPDLLLRPAGERRDLG